MKHIWFAFSALVDNIPCYTSSFHHHFHSEIAKLNIKHEICNICCTNLCFSRFSTICGTFCTIYDAYQRKQIFNEITLVVQFNSDYSRLNYSDYIESFLQIWSKQIIHWDISNFEISSINIASSALSQNKCVSMEKNGERRSEDNRSRAAVLVCAAWLNVRFVGVVCNEGRMKHIFSLLFFRLSRGTLGALHDVIHESR